MEVLAVDHWTGILGSQQEEEEKTARKQARLLVYMAKTQAANLVTDYLEHQGPMVLENGSSVQQNMEGIPYLNKDSLPFSPWKRLPLSLSAFSLLSAWLALVLHWQKNLNPKSKNLLQALELSRTNCRAICSNLASLLEQDVSFPTLTKSIPSFKQKVGGYLVCKCYNDWLNQTDQDLLILSSESPV